MAKFNRRDIELLRCIAECRFLTIRQATALLGRSERGAANRFRELEKDEYVRSTSHNRNGRRGRPEKVLFLKSKGIIALRDNKVAIGRGDARFLTATNVSAFDHQLMVNDFRVHLRELSHDAQQLKANFLSETSPFLPRQAEGRPYIGDVVRVGKRNRAFIPDGVFSLNHTGAGKRLLFFLEADRGTEAEAKIQQKLETYQAYFRTDGYKRYEESFGCQLHGFRLLIVVDSGARFTRLCHLVCRSRPSDFVWLTDIDEVVGRGLAARIWARGGRLDRPRESILGSQAPEVPS